MCLNSTFLWTAVPLGPAGANLEKVPNKQVEALTLDGRPVLLCAITPKPKPPRNQFELQLQVNQLFPRNIERNSASLRDERTKIKQKEQRFNRVSRASSLLAADVPVNSTTRPQLWLALDRCWPSTMGHIQVLFVLNFWSSPDRMLKPWTVSCVEKFPSPIVKNK